MYSALYMTHAIQTYISCICMSTLCKPLRDPYTKIRQIYETTTLTEANQRKTTQQLLYLNIFFCTFSSRNHFETKMENSANATISNGIIITATAATTRMAPTTALTQTETSLDSSLLEGIQNVFSIIYICV